jgi:hypothetical protein
VKQQDHTVLVFIESLVQMSTSLWAGWTAWICSPGDSLQQLLADPTDVDALLGPS